MMTREQLDDALAVKTTREDRRFTYEQARQILDAVHEMESGMTLDQRTVMTLWASLEREFVKGQRCGVCAREAGPGNWHEEC